MISGVGRVLGGEKLAMGKWREEVAEVGVGVAEEIV